LELIAHAGNHDMGDAIVREFGSCPNSKFYMPLKAARRCRAEPRATTAPKRR
jgi:hypothetical protein